MRTRSRYHSNSTDGISLRPSSGTGCQDGRCGERDLDSHVVESATTDGAKLQRMDGDDVKPVAFMGRVSSVASRETG